MLMASTLHTAGSKIWQTLASIKTGVVLLILTVIVAAAGTVILQRPNTEADEMQAAYSPQILRLLDATRLTDVYHAWWFVLLLFLVSCSIIAASIERFPNAWRFYSRPYKRPDESFRKALRVQALVPVRDEDEGLAAAERTLKASGLKPETLIGFEHASLFAEKNRMAEMAVFIVHTSLLLIFLGGIVDALFAWHSSIDLTQGQQSAQLQLKSGALKTLPFAIRCDAAGRENYPDGSPKKWWSKLAVVENGRDVLTKEITVNDPLVYQGVRFYQSSFGSNGKVDKLTLNAHPNQGADPAKPVAMGQGETVAIDADTTVQFAQFIPDYVVSDGQVYTRSAQAENPAAHLIVTSLKTGKRVNVWIPPIEGFDQTAESPYRFDVQDLKMGYFTGLQVSHEPGQWAVWGGVLLMGVGLGFVFYLSHVRFWVMPVRDARGHTQLWVGGMANRNRDAFEQRFGDVVEKIKLELEAGAADVEQEVSALAGD